MNVRFVVLGAQPVRAKRVAQLVQPLGVRLMVGDVQAFGQIGEASLHLVPVDRQKLVVPYATERPVLRAGEFGIVWLISMGIHT